jgi:hypothetical protein
MVGRREVENSNYSLHRVAGVAQQLRGAGDPGEIDDPLQVGCASGAELSREVFSAYPESRGKSSGAHGALHFADQDIPGGLLQRLGEPQHAGSVPQGPAALCRDGGAEHQIADYRIIHPLHCDACDRVATAGQEQLAIIGTERSICYDRYRRQIRSEAGQVGQKLSSRC